MTAHIIDTAVQYGIDLFLAICLGVFLRYVVPFIRAKLDAENLEYIKTVVALAVAAAEEKFVGEKLGLSVRKPWVRALVEGLGICVDDLIDAMIDAAARALTTATKVTEQTALEAVTEATQGRVTEDTANKAADALAGAVWPTEARP